MTDPFLPGSDWEIGPDGVPWRAAARVLLLDAGGRVLLARAHDVDQPERTWWFTIGGGIEAGESAREAAAREVEEETGLAIDPAELIGPVASRSATFDFLARHVHQDEVFFCYRLANDGMELDTSGWTHVERAFLETLAWFTQAGLEALEEEVFPPELPELTAWLREGWDGVLRRLSDQWD